GLDADAHALAVAAFELAGRLEIVAMPDDRVVEFLDSLPERRYRLHDRRNVIAVLLDQRHHHGDLGDGAVRAGAIRFVDHKDVADLHDAGLDGLDVVAHSGDEDDDVRLHGADDVDFIL